MFTLNPASVNSGPMGTDDLPLHVWLQERNKICGDWCAHVSLRYGLRYGLYWKDPIRCNGGAHQMYIGGTLLGSVTRKRSLKSVRNLTRRQCKEWLSLLDLGMFICRCSICDMLQIIAQEFSDLTVQLNKGTRWSLFCCSFGHLTPV